jgi:signal peptide peptidase SppA
MDPIQLQALADSIALALEKIPADTLKAAQEATAARPKAGARSNTDRPLYDLRDGVAHISVSGVILKEVPCIFDLLGMPATSTLAIQRALGAAVEDDAVKSISLDIDSPGGSLAGVQELADDVAAASGLKPTIAHASDLIASAAYWIGSQASRLSSNEAAMVGSIGVYSVIEDASAADAAAGIKVHVLRSSPLKGAGAGDSLTTAQLADQQRIVDEAATMFTAAVARGRHMTIDDAQKVSTGQLWFAGEAMHRGLIDSITSSATAHAAIATISTPSLSQITAPSVGALEEKPMSETKILAAQADAEGVDKLKADLAAANARNVALEANAKALDDQRKEALLGQYRDRIAPAALFGFKQAAIIMNADDLEKWLKDLPIIAHIERLTGAGDTLPAQILKRAQSSIEERSLAKIFGQSPERCRDMQAIGDNVDHVEYERTITPDGKVIMEPMAVLQDGNRTTRKELRNRLGLTGAVAGIAFLLSLLFTGSAYAALTAARATECKNFAGGGSVKAYLMKASHTIYSGSLVMIDSTGLAHPAEASASNHGVVGVAQETKSSGASGNYWIRVSGEVLCKFVGVGMAQTQVGSIVYASADDTVSSTQGTNEPIAGVMLEYISSTSGWIYISPVMQARYYYSATDPLTLTGDLTLSGGGAGAITFTDSTASIVVGDGDTTALDIGSSGNTSLLRLSTGTNAGKLTISGYAGALALSVAVGTVTFADDLTLSGAAGALTFGTAASSILLNSSADNSATGLVLGSTGATTMLTFDTTDSHEHLIIGNGLQMPIKAITGQTTLGLEDCGKMVTVSAGLDTHNIVLPPASTATGCLFRFVYVGADASVDLTITPTDAGNADTIIGNCTTSTGTIVSLNTAADGDINLTKGTSLKGDGISLMGCSSSAYCVVQCQGVWAKL